MGMREREQGIKKLLEEIMIKIFSNLVKGKDTQVQEAHKIPNKMNPKRPTPKHIIIKMPKVKEKQESLKAAIERQESFHKTVS